MKQCWWQSARRRHRLVLPTQSGETPGPPPLSPALPCLPPVWPCSSLTRSSAGSADGHAYASFVLGWRRRRKSGGPATCQPDETLLTTSRLWRGTGLADSPPDARHQFATRQKKCYRDVDRIRSMGDSPLGPSQLKGHAAHIRTPQHLARRTGRASCTLPAQGDWLCVDSTGSPTLGPILACFDRGSSAVAGEADAATIEVESLESL